METAGDVSRPLAGTALYAARRAAAPASQGLRWRRAAPSPERVSTLRVTIADALGRRALVGGICRRLGAQRPNPDWFPRFQAFGPAPDRVIFKAVSILPVSFRRGAHWG